MKILFLSAWFPYPPDNGARLRVYNLLRGLAPQHEVTLISLTERPGAEPPDALKGLCQEIFPIAAKPYRPDSLRALLGLFARTPRVYVDQYSPDFAQRISREVTSKSYDLVVASQLSMGAYRPWYAGVPAVLEEVEVGVFDDRRRQAKTGLGRLRRGLTVRKLRAYLGGLLPQFQAATVVSEVERRLLEAMVPEYDRIEVIPNGVNLADYTGILRPPQANRLIFTGSFSYRPNYEAMCWFLDKVYPLVKAQVPGVEVIITGDHQNLPVPSQDEVRLTGFVEDVKPLVATSWASLTPIHTGGGTRLKILEAMALRTPVIATPKGAEGLEVREGEDILIAATPEAFAEKTVRLLKSSSLRARLAAGGSRLIREKYDWPVILPRFLSLLDSAAQDPQDKALLPGKLAPNRRRSFAGRTVACGEEKSHAKAQRS